MDPQSGNAAYAQYTPTAPSAKWNRLSLVAFFFTILSPFGVDYSGVVGFFKPYGQLTLSVISVVLLLVSHAQISRKKEKGSALNVISSLSALRVLIFGFLFYTSSFIDDVSVFDRWSFGRLLFGFACIVVLALYGARLLTRSAGKTYTWAVRIGLLQLGFLLYLAACFFNIAGIGLSVGMDNVGGLLVASPFVFAALSILQIALAGISRKSEGPRAGTVVLMIFGALGVLLAITIGAALASLEIGIL